MPSGYISNERRIALENGEKFYFTGHPCKRGHICNRYTTTLTCVQCIKEQYKPIERQKYRLNDKFKNQFIQRRSGAKSKGIPFTVEFEEIDKPTHCPILGCELTYEWDEENPYTPNKATLDRLIPNKGYVPGNVYVVSSRANSLKNSSTIEELEAIIKYIKERS